jgi:hypothetical protein
LDVDKVPKLLKRVTVTVPNLFCEKNNSLKEVTPKYHITTSMSALTHVTVFKSVKVRTEVTFECPREIAELFKTKSETCERVDIFVVKKVFDFVREYGIEEPGTYMIWEEEDGTKKSYKLKNYYSSDEYDEYEIDNITLEDDSEDDDDEECLRCDWCRNANEKVRVLRCDECGDANEKVKFCNNLNHSHYNINCNNPNHSHFLICEYCDVPAKCIGC